MSRPIEIVVEPYQNLAPEPEVVEMSDDFSTPVKPPRPVETPTEPSLDDSINTFTLPDEAPVQNARLKTAVVVGATLASFAAGFGVGFGTEKLEEKYKLLQNIHDTIVPPEKKNDDKNDDKSDEKKKNKT